MTKPTRPATPAELMLLGGALAATFGVVAATAWALTASDTIRAVVFIFAGLGALVGSIVFTIGVIGKGVEAGVRASQR